MKGIFFFAAVLLTLNSQLLAVFGQGSLTPPAAPAPTMKTLDQVEPRIPVSVTTTPGDATSVFKITQPGSYYLTGNITGVSGKHGIFITTGNVTLDLMGFDMVGVAGSLDGIHVDNTAVSINYTVRNGTLRNWGGSGLQLNVQGKHRIQDIRALNNGGFGIESANATEIDRCVAFGNAQIGIYAVAGTVTNSTGDNNGTVGIYGYTVDNCHASGNGAEGIHSPDGSVTHSYVVVNTGDGIVGDFGTVITGCTVIANTGNGITLDKGSITVDCYVRGNHAIGISATDGSRIAGCTSRENDGAGISTGSDCVIEHCAAVSNVGEGIIAGSGATVSDCNASANQTGFGIHVGSQSVVRHCVAEANTSSGTSSGGISSGASALVIDCVSSNNTSTAGSLTSATGQGIVVSSGSAVHHCMVRSNKGDGIRVGTDTIIEGNTADGNGNGTGDGAGIHLTSSDCRVDANNVTDNDRGIDVDVAGNLIVRNSASGNTTNYDIVAGNAVGAIVVTAASGAVSGSGPLASSLGSIDPWANFSF